MFHEDIEYISFVSECSTIANINGQIQWTLRLYSLIPNIVIS